MFRKTEEPREIEKPREIEELGKAKDRSRGPSFAVECKLGRDCDREWFATKELWRWNS